MRDGWTQKKLGDIFSLSGTRVGQAKEEPVILSVTKYDGIVPASEYFDKRIASKSIDKYKILGAGDWAYSTIHIDEGSIARNNTGIHGAVSPMYTTMHMIDNSILPRILDFIVRSEEMLHTYHQNQQGSINRRRSLPWKVFKSLSIDLPPLREQQRIVDLMDAVDAAISAAQAEVETTVELLGRYRDTHLWSTDSRIELGELCGVDGKLVDPTGENAAMVHVGTDRIVGGTGDILGAVSAEEDGVTSGKYRFDERHIVYSKIRPNLMKVASPDFTGLCSADAYPLLPADNIPRIYLQQLLLSSNFTEASVSRSSRTKMPKINRTGLLTIEVPDHSMEFVAETSQVLLAMNEARIQAQNALDRIGKLRSSMLTVLLSGEHEIPETYDQFLTESTEG